MSAPANRQPHIQGLRAVAVLVVILFHAGLPVPGGFTGVDVFFVISGYVITAMLLRELATTGRVDFPRFYLRRFKRLTPALALVVSVTAALSAFVLSPLGPQQQAAQTALGALGLAANAVIAATTGGYFDAPAEANPLLNMWSLSVEEQFYLGFPALMALAWAVSRRTGRPAHVMAAVAAVGAASLALAMWGAAMGPQAGFWLGFYSPVTRAWEFAAGALLALAPAVRWTLRGALVAQSAGVGLLLFALWEIDGAVTFPGPLTLLPVAATLLLLTTGGERRTPVGALLSSRLAVRVGDWSYSLYLWHWPAIVLATALWPRLGAVAPLAAALSVVPALLSYRFLEEPLRQREVTGRGLAAMVAVTVMLPVFAAGSLWWAAESVWKPRVQQAAPAAARAQHAGYALGCHYEPGDGNADPTPCRWQAEASGTPVYLLGDSNAAQFVEALIDATASQQRPLIVTTSSGCPLLDVVLAGPDFPGYGTACRDRNLRLLQWMEAQAPGTVVLAASDHYWLEPGWSAQAAGRAAVAAVPQRQALLRESLIRVVERLQATGHRVVLVQTIPHWTGTDTWDPARCSLSAALQGCRQEMPLARAQARSEAVRSVVAQVADATEAALLDVAEDVCPQGICRTATANLPVYRDATHITVAMSHALAGRFATAIND